MYTDRYIYIYIIYIVVFQNPISHTTHEDKTQYLHIYTMEQTYTGI